MAATFLTTCGRRMSRAAGAVRPRRASGFTLIEILIVVIILGIIAGIVIPSFSNASHTSRENTMKDALRYLRTQITIFKAQHRDVSPGYPGGDPAAAPDETTFLEHMTKFTDEYCNVNSVVTDVYKFGPYLSQMPANPMNSKIGVWVVSGQSMPAPDESQPYGWIYNPETQTIIANLSGADASGTPYSQY